MVCGRNFSLLDAKLPMARPAIDRNARGSAPEMRDVACVQRQLDIHDGYREEARICRYAAESSASTARRQACRSSVRSAAVRLPFICGSRHGVRIDSDGGWNRGLS